jgi:hypothetical protein
MFGPIGMIVSHKPTERLGVVVSIPTPTKVGFTPVQFSEESTSKHEVVDDKELEDVKKSYSVSPDVLTDAPHIVKELLKSGPVMVSYGTGIGTDTYRVVYAADGELALVPMR